MENNFENAFAELAVDKEALAEIRELEGTIGDGLENER
jgi:hypothetical protein